MAEMVLSMFISVDGYINGPNGEFVGPKWSSDLARHWSGCSLSRAAHLIYGRVNFQFNKSFWEPAATDPSSTAAAIPHAAIMNRLPKTVFSKTLQGDPGWNGTLAHGGPGAVVARLKSEVEGEIHMFGGAEIAQSFIREDLFDQYRLMITPNLFGGGKRLFEPGFRRLDLELLETQRLDTGAVILHYRRNR